MLIFRNNLQTLLGDIKLIAIFCVADIVALFFATTLVKVYSVTAVMNLQKQVLKVLLAADNPVPNLSETDKMARIPEVLSLKGVLSGDLVQLIEGFIQSIACLAAAIAIQKELGIYIIIVVIFHLISCAFFGFFACNYARDGRTWSMKTYYLLQSCFKQIRSVNLFNSQVKNSMVFCEFIFIRLLNVDFILH